ncbi:hypothetical protein KGF56_000877 [Candida oxycetoniae]|uniref:Uncharacterized protein n=1 Tax=Candida oxycetoniae TaxID=497107 RepID=A0AAI9T051_9ASCO|nr:uncharacterized protein KGF56_000877 [Candida oxycetoniae]KAI3406396.2 hypothetical protein KGF56_000877 [Candida oxycetoniae]
MFKVGSGLMLASVRLAPTYRSISPIFFSRFKSSLPTHGSNNGKKKTSQLKNDNHLPTTTTSSKNPLPSPSEWERLKLHIPGEQVQTNTLKDRVPKFPLGKENVPTLLPRPGVPQVGKQYTFKQVIKILQNKKQPELIYESEPHRLYFLLCFCCSVVFAVYGCVLFEWAFWVSKKNYDENEKEEANDAIRTRDYYISLAKCLAPSAIMLCAAFGAAIFPTRMMRRMWYLPGVKEHIRFTTYPMFPGRPTPVYTVPLANLSRRKTARVWTGKGFYGTADKGFFFFVLREKTSKRRVKNWIVDRKGFFWSDGRVFDYLFGKETLREAEAGIPYDQQFRIVNKQLKAKKQKLRAEHGLLWKYKLAWQDFRKDIGGAKRSLIGSGKSDKETKKLPKN